MAFFMIAFALLSIYTLVFIPHLRDAFIKHPILFIVPVLTFLSIANVPRLANKKKYGKAFFFSSLTISFLLILSAIELYPNLLLSTVGNEYTINIYNAASSTKSLSIMLAIVAIGGPLVLAYTIFVYKTFWGKVKLDENSY